MARFHEAFFFLARDADTMIHTVRDNDLVNTVVVPVPDATGAAAVAADLTDRGLDLIELYGGFGPTAAAEVIDAIDGRVPVGLVGVDEEVAARHRAVIFYAPDADPASDRYVYEHDGGTFTIVAAPDPTAVPGVAEALVAEGADRIELCGGLGTLPAAATIEAVGSRVPVRPVLYGFESMPGVAAYRARFEAAVGTQQLEPADPTRGQFRDALTACNSGDPCGFSTGASGRHSSYDACFDQMLN